MAFRQRDVLLVNGIAGGPIGLFKALVRIVGRRRGVLVCGSGRCSKGRRRVVSY